MKKTVIIVLCFLAVMLGIYFILPHYVQTALKYKFPGINDLKVFPYRTVKTGTPQPYELDAYYNKGKIKDEEYQEIKSYNTVAYLVTRHGKILYEEYWGKSTDSTNYNIFSASKSIISLLIGIAMDKGFIISENELANKYIPEWGEKYGSITIKDLLTMSSGLYWVEDFTSPFCQTTELYYGKDNAKQVLSLEPVKKPGKYYYYSSANTVILGIILKNATGMTVSDFASEYLWSKIGAEHDAQWSLDNKGGIEKANCCFYSNARDLARIGQLVLNDGKWNGEQVVSKDWLERSFTPASYLSDNNDQRVDYYGYQWWLLNYQGLHIKYACGLYGQDIFVIPEKDMVVVRQGYKRDKEYVGHHTKDVYSYIDAALEICGE